MSNSYAAVSVLIFAIVAIMHLVRIINGWSVVVEFGDVRAVAYSKYAPTVG